MEQSLRQLRHDVRGKLNTLMLCAAALPHASNDAEAAEFIDEIAVAADKVVVLLDQLESAEVSETSSE